MAIVKNIAPVKTEREPDADVLNYLKTADEKRAAKTYERYVQMNAARPKQKQA